MTNKPFSDIDQDRVARAMQIGTIVFPFNGPPIDKSCGIDTALDKFRSDHRYEAIAHRLLEQEEAKPEISEDTRRKLSRVVTNNQKMRPYQVAGILGILKDYPKSFLAVADVIEDTMHNNLIGTYIGPGWSYKRDHVAGNEEGSIFRDMTARDFVLQVKAIDDPKLIAAVVKSVSIEFVVDAIAIKSTGSLYLGLGESIFDIADQQQSYKDAAQKAIAAVAQSQVAEGRVDDFRELAMDLAGDGSSHGTNHSYATATIPKETVAQAARLQLEQEQTVEGMESLDFANMLHAFRNNPGITAGIKLETLTTAMDRLQALSKKAEAGELPEPYDRHAIDCLADRALVRVLGVALSKDGTDTAPDTKIALANAKKYAVGKKLVSSISFTPLI